MVWQENKWLYLHNYKILCIITFIANNINPGGNKMILLTTTTSDWLPMIAIYAVLIGGFYFMLIRPQKKEQKRVAAMIAEVAIGDTILTNSGFYGVVIDVTEADVIVEFGNNKNCRIPMQKAAIAQVEKVNAE